MSIFCKNFLPYVGELLSLPIYFPGFTIYFNLSTVHLRADLSGIAIFISAPNPLESKYIDPFPIIFFIALGLPLLITVVPNESSVVNNPFNLSDVNDIKSLVDWTGRFLTGTDLNFLLIYTTLVLGVFLYFA